MPTRSSITFANPHSEDIEVLVLGELGLFSRAIAAKTGLSVCQVNYRLNKAGITRRGYRDGSSRTVQSVISLMAPDLRPNVQRTALQELAKRDKEKAALSVKMNRAATKAARKLAKRS